MKILFVGDPHLNYQTPQSRKDIYPQTILDKVKSIADIANKNGYITIFLGDMFHQRYQPYSYMMKCYQAFKTFQQAPYSLVGNHDLIFEREDTFNESPLNFLFMTDVVKPLQTLQIDDTVIQGFNYTQPIQVNSSDKYTVCVAHQYYNTPLYKHYIKPEDAYNLNYNAYVLGHDHQVYDPVQNNKFIVIRPGSLSRGTATNSNLHRDIYAYLFDTVTHDFTRITIPSLPSTEVFKEIKYIEKSLDKSVDEIINNMEFDSDDTIYDQLDNTELPDKVRDLIIRYLEDNGIFRKS